MTKSSAITGRAPAKRPLRVLVLESDVLRRRDIIAALPDGSEAWECASSWIARKSLKPGDPPDLIVIGDDLNLLDEKLFATEIRRLKIDCPIIVAIRRQAPKNAGLIGERRVGGPQLRDAIRAQDALARTHDGHATLEGTADERKAAFGQLVSEIQVATGAGGAP